MIFSYDEIFKLTEGYLMAFEKAATETMLKQRPNCSPDAIDSNAHAYDCERLESYILKRE